MGAFYSSQGNLVVGVLEIRTYPDQGSDMSDNFFWNPAWGPDMSSLTDLIWDKAEMSDISEQGVEHVRDMFSP
jgi:hypothetical protein